MVQVRIQDYCHKSKKSPGLQSFSEKNEDLKKFDKALSGCFDFAHKKQLLVRLGTEAVEPDGNLPTAYESVKGLLDQLLIHTRAWSGENANHNGIQVNVI